MGRNPERKNFGTIKMTIRLDLEAMATVAKWMRVKNMVPINPRGMTQSQFVNDAIKSMARGIMENGDITRVKTYDTAIQELRKLNVITQKASQKDIESIKPTARSERRGKKHDFEEMRRLKQEHPELFKKKMEELANRGDETAKRGKQQADFSSPDAEAEEQRTKRQMEKGIDLEAEKKKAKEQSKDKLAEPEDEDDIITSAEGTHDEVAGLPSQGDD